MAMWGQTGNFRSDNLAATVLFKKTSVLAVALLTLFLSACIPVGDEQVNTELFKSKEDMRDRAALLSPGMPMKQVFEKIEINKDKFSRMSTQEVQMSIYGNSLVQGSPDQLEKFREKLAGYEGYSLPYRDIKGSGSLGFGTLRVNKTGYDLKLVLIFDKGKLMRTSVDGNQQVDTNEDQSLFNVLMKRSTGISF
jgi:hypothetical protein